MFWKLSFRQPSAIDTLLDKEDCTLNEILDEDDVIQECKAQNKKLIDFISHPEILEQLIGLISKEHDENEEDKVKFKYPHIACELLTSEVFAIVEQLSENEHLMALLWAFLDSPETLNPLVGSFISKVLAMLLNQKPLVIFDFMKRKDEFISLFLTHLGTSAMMDLLLQMVAAPDSDQTRLELAVWLKEQGIVERLVDFIGPQADPEQCGNASQALCDMIRLSREAVQMASPTPLLATLESEEVMQRLLDNMFSSESPSDVVIVHGIAVILTTLEKSRPGNELGPAGTNSFGEAEGSLSTAGNAEIVEQLLAIVLPRVKDFHNLLTRRPNISPMVMTVGTLDPPLGNTRLQVVRLFSALLQCNETRISREIARLKTFCVLMDLFFQFPWNNFLHTQVELCVTAAIFSPVLLKNGGGKGEEEEGNEDQENGVSLRHHLLTDCQMVHRLLKGEELNNADCSQDSRGRRQGYMGHLVRMTNRFVECGEGDEKLKSMMKLALDEDTQQRWNEFISGPIADMNKKNETNLGGTRPMTSSMDESDEEFDPVGGGPDSELEKAYQIYQDVKYISPMVDDYGVDDALNPVEEPFAQTFTRLMEVSCAVSAEEEQSPAMFEAACSERIQQFDDSESDEEESSTWVDKDVAFITHMDEQSPRSLSSDEDEDFERRRELPTSSSDEDDTLSKRAALYLATTSPSTLSKMTEDARQQQAQSQDPDKIEIDHMNAVSWHSEISTDEDLSRVVAMDTGGGMADWTKEPEPVVSSPSSSWADFTTFEQSHTMNNTTPQDMELEPALEPSNIVVPGTTSEEANRPPPDDEMAMSPERHDSSKYMRLSPGSSNNGEQQEPSSPLDTGSVLISVSHNSESSSEDEGHTSSDSDEERSGTYALNLSTSSDGDPLLMNSPAQPAPPEPVQQEEEAQSAHVSDAGSPSRDCLITNATPTSHDTSANGVQETATAMTTITQNQSNKSEDKEDGHSESNRNSDSVGLNDINPSESHQTTSTGGGERVNENSRQNVDGEVGEKDLHDNFSFLSSQGLLSEGGTRKKVEVSDELTDERLIEEKRAEAREACMQWEQTVQGSHDQTENLMYHYLRCRDYYYY